MNKKTKKQLIIGGLVTGAVLLWVNNQSKASVVNTAPATPTPNTPTTPTPNKPVSPVVTYPAGFPIVFGKYNVNAKRLQQAMTGIGVDGIIGPQTLLRWQQFNPSIKKDFVIANEAQLQSAIAQINSKYNQLPTFPTVYPSIFAQAETVVPPTLYYGNNGDNTSYTREDRGEVVSGVKSSLL